MDEAEKRIRRCRLPWSTMPNDDETAADARRLFYEEELRPGIVCRRTGIPYPRLPRVLGFDSKEEMDRERRRITARQRYRSGYTKVRPKVLERDGHKCVVTGRTEGLEVHHIDGDRENASMDNLVTLHKSVHKAVTHGLTLKRPLDQHHSNFIHNRHKLIESYVEWLGSRGHVLAHTYVCKSCRKAHVRPGPRVPKGRWRRPPFI